MASRGSCVLCRNGSETKLSRNEHLEQWSLAPRGRRQGRAGLGRDGSVRSDRTSLAR